MEIFVWVVIIAVGLEVILKVWGLFVDYVPPRNKLGIVLDCIAGMILVVWGAVLLAKA